MLTFSCTQSGEETQVFLKRVRTRHLVYFAGYWMRIKDTAFLTKTRLDRFLSVIHKDIVLIWNPEFRHNGVSVSILRVVRS